MGTRRRALGACIAAATLLSVGCGAKTGLLIPDSGPDAGMDAAMDAGVDTGVCMPEELALERRGAQILFAIDRSNSMDDTIEGERRDPGDPRPSRWDILGTTLGAVLADADPLLEIGAKFFPAVQPEGRVTPEEACSVDLGIDIPPARNNVPALLATFARTGPGGGTPTAPALEEVQAFFERRPAFGVPRFVILATDGGPNCNPDTGVPPDRCVCTGPPATCTDNPEFGPYNCLDEPSTLPVIEAIFTTFDAPVYVIGLDDPMRPDLADVLDHMAVAGGRPREIPGERRFYSVRRTDDLRNALTTITDSIARCVFNVSPIPRPDASVELRVDDVLIARDGTRTEGWDFSAPDRSEITLFGGACERVTVTGGTVTAEILCEAE
jgi:hypothetical protein